MTARDRALSFLGRLLDRRPAEADVASLAHEFEAVRREALEEACRAACSFCDEFAPRFHEDVGWYHGDEYPAVDPYRVACYAQEIRALLETMPHA